MRLTTVLSVLVSLAGAHAQADVVLNSFESGGGVGGTAFSAWSRVTPPGGPPCAVSPGCPVVPGACATVYQISSTATDGSRCGAVFMQALDDGSIPGDLVDCHGNDSTTNAAYRTLSLTNFSPHDWSSGFLRVQYDARKVSPSDPLETDIQFKDGGGKTALASFNIGSNNVWNTFTVNIQDLANAGLDTTNIAEVDLIAGGADPQPCTTVYFDNLRLQGGTPPCPPTGVTAIGTGVSGQISVSWSEVCAPTFAITGYCVYRATYPFSNPLNAQVTTCGLAGSPLVVGGLTDGKPYWFKVVAIDSAGNASSGLDPIQLNINAIPFCGTAAPGASAVAWTSAIRVIWSPVGGATSYKIYKSTWTPVACFDRGPLRTVMPGASVYFDDFNVTVGGNFCYVVTAVAGGCESTCSNAGCDTFTGAGSPPCSPPGPVPNFTLTPGQGNMTLNWDQPVAGANPLFKYEIWRATFSGPFWTKTQFGAQVGTVFDTGASSYTHIDPSLAPVQNYCYILRAVDTGGCTSFSPEQCASTLCNLNPPGAQAAQGYCDRVRVSWGAVSATTFQIYKAPSPATCVALQTPANLVASLPSVSLYFDDFAVTNGQTYDYAVTASSPTCESACGGAVAALFQTTDPCPPAPPCTPPGVIGTPTGSAGTQQVVIHWNRPVTGGTTISRYFVWEGVGSSGSLAGKSVTATVWDAPGGPVFTATFTGLAQDTTHCFLIEVTDAGSPGCTNFSAEACFTTSCVPPSPTPAVSVGVSPALGPGATPSSSLLVAWGAAVPGELAVSAYAVYRATVAGGIRTLVGVVPDTGALSYSFTNSGVIVTQNYCYSIRAADAGGCTSWSAEVCHACNPPGLVGTPVITSLSASQLRLDWAKPAPGEVAVSRYLIFRATVSGGPQILAGTTWDDGIATAFSFTNTGVVTANTYCYQVLALDLAGCSNISVEQCHGCSPPVWAGACADPACLGAVALSATLIQLSWQPALAGSVDNPVSRYLIYRTTGPGCSWATVAATVYASTGASIYVDAVQAAGSYDYAIGVVSVDGCSATASDCVSVGTTGLCVFLSGPSATLLPGPTASPRIQLDWTSSDTGTITGFKIWRGGSATGSTAGKTLVQTLPGSTSSYVDSALAAGQEYCYVVELNANPPCTVVSNEACATTPSLAFAAYPNPAKLSEGGVRFDGLDPAATVELYTLTGELVRSTTVAGGGLWTWDGRNDGGGQVASGIYLYIVRNKTATIKGKLVVAR